MNEERQAQLEAQIAKLETVSTAPVILQPLLEILRQSFDDIRTEKVVELVSRDGAIAAQCVRMANSPLFAHRPVETIRAAILTLGIEKVRSLVFGLCMNRTVPTNKWVLDANSFWRHSLGCALANQMLAQRISYPEPEKAYLAGLLHDIGVLVNSVLYNVPFRKCQQQAISLRCPLHVAEKEILGFTHSDSGALLCKRWGFSEELTEAVRCHHLDGLSPSIGPLTCLVRLGDLLCRVRNLGHGYEENLIVLFESDTAWRRLIAIYPSLAEMDLVRLTLDIDASLDQIATLVDAVFGPPKSATAPVRERSK
jgi:HD-like signal output (HDOD) protein